jgi:hypothetical protein
MSVPVVVIEGTVKPDGTLEVADKLPIPAGRVRVTVQPLAEPAQPERFWKMMESIWSDLQARGRPSRSREQIDADIQAGRDEAEEEMQVVDRLHEASRQPREQARGETEPGL